MLRGRQPPILGWAAEAFGVRDKQRDLTMGGRWCLPVIAMAMIALAGCKKEQSEVAGDESALPRAAVTLKIAVVNDEPLRRAIDRLRGEWKTLTDGEVETVAASLDASSDADLIVFPSRAIGELCEADVLRPMRDGVLRSESLRFDDFLPLIRDHEIVYGQQTMALPIGCPTPVMLVADPEGPSSLKASDDDVELGLAYLAWAAPHAVHRSRVATLFDPDDFTPRLDEPPFVRALELFVDAVGGGGDRVVWPQRETPLPEGVSVTRFPGADEAFAPLSDAWESTGGERAATLIASSGRLIGVTTASRNAATAFRYAAWLVGPDNARMLSTASNNVANCRGSLARAADRWFDTEDREAGKAFADESAEALRESRFLFAPRLPAADEYLAALGACVRSAIKGQPAPEALAEATAEWSAISDRQGIEAQREAYFRSINARSFSVDGP
ncbi:MAG: hypothetical protein AAF266_06225 [Planctomycetota bacterium]